ncbi:hypothetical protein BT69DRAFT_1291125 [Atractiella rhizophila]|nr:hypothetical protein BT69DRAFT_1291125 [Atractiella rhizophila]
MPYGNVERQAFLLMIACLFLLDLQSTGKPRKTVCKWSSCHVCAQGLTLPRDAVKWITWWTHMYAVYLANCIYTSRMKNLSVS